MSGRGRAVVQALRADHRLLGAGVAVRLLLARPDAVGLLARPRQVPEHEKGWITRLLDRFNHWFNGLADALPAGHRLGARPSPGDGGDRAAVVLRRALRAVPVGRRRLHAGLRQQRAQRAGGDAAGLAASTTRGSRPRRRRASRARYPEVRVHLHHDRRQTRAPVDSASIYVKLMPKAERERSQEAVGQQLRGDVGAARRRHHLGVHRLDERQLQADPDRAARPRLGRADAARRAHAAAGRGRCRGRSTSASRRAARSPSSRWSCERGLAGSLGLSVGAGGAVAVPGLRRPRRRRLGGPDRRDPRRHGAARARGAARAPPTWSGCRWSVRGAGRRRPAGAARPGGDHPRGPGAGGDQPPRPRPRGHPAGQRLRPLAQRGAGRHHAAAGSRAAAAGLRAHPGRRGQGPGRGVRQDLRSRSASR